MDAAILGKTSGAYLTLASCSGSAMTEKGRRERKKECVGQDLAHTWSRKRPVLVRREETFKIKNPRVDKVKLEEDKRA